ncbi:MAG: glycosyl hydrolase 115 family protein, partial [Nocardioides sp.]|nr:glycosyl hydrolase 115 family protein [Nocardioides sp.]
MTATGAYVSFAKSDGAFPLAAGGHAAPIVVSGSDYTGVRRTVGDLADDVNRVTGIEPKVTTSDAIPTDSDRIVIVGTLGHSPLIDRLASQHKIDSATIKGKWETSIEQVVDNPVPGVKQALVIAGGDQRGSIYGAYDVSRGIGVSPWYWWDDVKPTHRDSLYIDAGTHTQGTPAVKYRGFFINDENPSLGRAAKNLFGEGKAPGYPGGFNHLLYAKVFEAGLRLKANYIWPAVWGRTFDQDDPENQQTATDYGIVMGTSHE